MIYILLLTGVLLNAGAQLLLKAGTNHIGEFSFSFENILPIGWQLASNLYILGGLTCYVISVGLWIMVLSRIPVSFAYPMLSIGYIVNALAAFYLFGEDLNPAKIAGIFVIIIGVFLLTRS